VLLFDFLLLKNQDSSIEVWSEARYVAIGLIGVSLFGSGVINLVIGNKATSEEE